METNMFDTIFDFNKSLSKVMPLAAIWLNKPIHTGNLRTVRIEAGETLRIENKAIVDVTNDNPATHKVIGCFGNVSNTILYFELQELKTGELSTLKIK